MSAKSGFDDPDSSWRQKIPVLTHTAKQKTGQTPGLFFIVGTSL